MEGYKSVDEDPRGANKWIPASGQWVLFGIICVLVVIWAVLTAQLPDSVSPSNSTWIGPELGLNTFAMPLVMLIVALIMFFGLVSYELPINKCFDALTDIMLVAVFAKLRVCIPYLTGCFATIFFLYPVQTATKKKLVEYDYGWYSLNVLWTTGASNAYTALLVNQGAMSIKARWLGQSLGWPVIMSALVIVPMLMGVKMEAYKLKLDETIRYSAFQVSVYIFIFYGFSAHAEYWMASHGGIEAKPADNFSTAKVAVLGLALLVQFALGNVNAKASWGCFTFLVGTSAWILFT